MFRRLFIAALACLISTILNPTLAQTSGKPEGVIPIPYEKFVLPNGLRLVTRMTAVLRREADRVFRLVHQHYSWAVPAELAMEQVPAWREQLGLEAAGLTEGPPALSRKPPRAGRPSGLGRKYSQAWPAATRRIPSSSVGHIPLRYAVSLRPRPARVSLGQLRPYLRPRPLVDGGPDSRAFRCTGAETGCRLGPGGGVAR